MQSSVRSEKKNIFSDFVYQTNHKLRSAFTSGSSLALANSEPNRHAQKFTSFDTSTQTPKPEGKCRTIISKDANVQTNFKSSTSINLGSPRKYFIFKERHTQTSGTDITVRQAGKRCDRIDRLSPDSLSPRSIYSPRKRSIPERKKVSTSASGLSLAEMDQIAFNRKQTISNCLRRTIQPNDFKGGNLLTKTYLEKKNLSGQYMPQVKSFDSTLRPKQRHKRALKSQSFVEPPSYIERGCHANRFRVKSVIMNEPPEDHRHPVRYYCQMPINLSPHRNSEDNFEDTTPVQDTRSYSFMSPTLSSVKKDQSLELQSVKNLISPIRKGRVSPQVRLKVNSRADVRVSPTDSKKCTPRITPKNSPKISPKTSPRSLRSEFPKTNSSDKQVPYIDKSDATLIKVTGNRGVPKNSMELQVISSNEEMTGGSTLETTTSRTSECVLSQAINRLKNKDWNLALRGLAEVVEICRLVEPDIILPHMTTINQKLVELIKSPRSHVCRTACQAIGHMFEYVKDTRRPEFDEIVDTLLAKTADANKFTRQDANLSLDCMVTHISTFHAVRAICNKGPEHKNPLVRTASARLLVCAVVIAGPLNVLHPQNNEFTRKRIILNMVKFMDDRYQEIRKYGERLYKLLCKDRIFDLYLKRYVEKEVIVRIKQIVKTNNERR
ncbi:unnamed protein product [Acanthoscelides obtectus]|uniref:TOG domain-containing protein n=1 Tax=Acanthoscelides obtectus TaxID=200917 RepID=A0A9P0Q117_ACAOB|nr:unnamed protein product [Acanthoscelides obtectus]CAK1664064.1 TOG array regulator of axonemal microtubules protein 1 [Acanthoscelides obtectus]